MDAAGNESILSETISITFDNTPTDIDGYDDPINGPKVITQKRFTMNILL